MHFVADCASLGTSKEETLSSRNGGRKDERESRDGFKEKFCAPFGEGEPVRERRRKNEKDRGDKKGEAEGEEKFGHRGLSF